ncbi:glycerate dehydrogenase [Lentibacillus halophilus]|uniref:Glycerate dehydrogenase n=1 Tax=Lentibacillus halophilus TaxID=295065 RepID=A0ABN0Z4Y9_9BACI
MLVMTIDEFSKDQIQYLQDICSPMPVHLEPDIKNNSTLLNHVEVLITFGFDLTKETLEQMPSLKWVQVFQTGVEHIPIEELEERGILLTNVKGIYSTPMSEYVMSMILYYTRQLRRFIQEQQQHIWNREELVDEAGGKTIAIFGAGTIGTAIAEKARMFGMHVLGVNTSGQLRPHFDEMVTLDNKEKALKEGDFIVLLLPETKKTFHCIGRNELRLMKESAYLINIGRGGLVDTNALVNELNQKTIQGAALDVFEEDPLPKDHPLWDMNNVFITPHLSAKTIHFYDRCIEKFKMNFSRYQKGETMIDKVDLDKGY